MSPSVSADGDTVNAGDDQSAETWTDRVATALEDVVDPCSLAAGAPLSLVEMGLVRGSTFDARTGTLEVRLGVTGPGCTFFGAYSAAAATALSALPGVAHARVVLDTAGAWDPTHLTPAGQQVLDGRRALTVQLSGVRPRMWQDGA